MLLTSSDSDGEHSVLAGFGYLILLLALCLGLTALAAIILGVWTHIIVDAFELGWGWWA